MKNNTVLVVGSGPIIIGQAAEFDYAGAQACKSLREDGYRVVLINSNPATIMTDQEMADRVYIEPITTSIVEEIIKRKTVWNTRYIRRPNWSKFNFRIT